MVDLRLEGDNGWLERVVGGEVNVEAEGAALEGGVIRAEDHRLPLEEIGAVGGAGGAVGGRIPLEVGEFTL